MSIVSICKRSLILKGLVLIFAFTVLVFGTIIEAISIGLLALWIKIEKIIEGYK